MSAGTLGAVAPLAGVRAPRSRTTWTPSKAAGRRPGRRRPRPADHDQGHGQPPKRDPAVAVVIRADALRVGRLLGERRRCRGSATGMAEQAAAGDQWRPPRRRSARGRSLFLAGGAPYGRGRQRSRAAGRRRWSRRAAGRRGSGRTAAWPYGAGWPVRRAWSVRVPGRRGLAVRLLTVRGLAARRTARAGGGAYGDGGATGGRWDRLGRAGRLGGWPTPARSGRRTRRRCGPGRCCRSSSVVLARRPRCRSAPPRTRLAASAHGGERRRAGIAGVREARVRIGA